MRYLLFRILFFFCVCVLIASENAFAQVPGQSSSVHVSGRQLIFERRLQDGSLDSPEPYIIKGVTWSPATRAPSRAVNPLDLNSIVDYGFFFDWPGRVPQGHQILASWKKKQFQQYYNIDIPLMKQMNVNTVRVYEDFGDDPQVYNEILDELYRNNIMVIMTVAAGIDDLINERYLDLVSRYKDHPAVLMWSLGNEWNLNRYYADNAYSMDDLIAETNLAAAKIKQADPNHPVSSCLGDRFDLSYDPGDPCGWQPEASSDIPHIVNNCPNVDLWGINVYRGASFNNIFSQWFSAWGEENPKPFYFSEFGTDSFWSSTYHTPYKCMGLAKVDSGWENQDEQEAVFFLLWNEIVNQLSSNYPDALCLGGLVHEFNDELWKVGCFHAGLGDPYPAIAGFVDYDGPDNRQGTSDDDTSYDEYNTQGFVLNGGHRDNVADEEYFGVVDADRNPKKVFYQIQRAFAEQSRDMTPPTVPQVFDEGDYTESATTLSAEWVSEDPESGIAEYRYAIGISSGSDDVVGWTSAGTNTSITKTGLSLSGAHTYYFSVKAVNGEGLVSEIGSSDGIAVKALQSSAADVTLTFTKDASNWATFADAFTITNIGALAIGWQLYNNQDGEYTPPDGNPVPMAAQGFGFYESLGFVAAQDTFTVRAYINNNKPAGLYQGSYTLKQISGGRAIDIAIISYSLHVEDKAGELPAVRLIWPAIARPAQYVWICGSNFAEVDNLSRVYLLRGQKIYTTDIVRWCDRYILFKVPQIDSGDYKLKVVNRFGESNAEHFKVILSSPRITWVWPGWGREGMYVRIYGRDFGDRTSVSRVCFYKPGNTSYGSIISWSGRRIVFKVPKLKSRGWYSLRVYTRDGRSNVTSFYYY